MKYVGFESRIQKIDLVSNRKVVEIYVFNNPELTDSNLPDKIRIKSNNYSHWRFFSSSKPNYVLNEDYSGFNPETVSTYGIEMCLGKNNLSELNKEFIANLAKETGMTPSDLECLLHLEPIIL